MEGFLRQKLNWLGEEIQRSAPLFFLSLTNFEVRKEALRWHTRILARIQTLIASGLRSGLFIRVQVSFFFFLFPSDCNARTGRQPHYEGNEEVSKSEVLKPFAASLLSDRSDSD